MPAFTYRSVKNLNALFWQKAHAMLENILQNNDGELDGWEIVVEVSEIASRVTLDIMGVAALDRDLQSLSQNGSPLADYYHQLFDRTAYEVVLDFITVSLPRAIGHSLP